MSGLFSSIAPLAHAVANSIEFVPLDDSPSLTPPPTSSQSSCSSSEDPSEHPGRTTPSYVPTIRPKVQHCSVLCGHGDAPGAVRSALHNPLDLDCVFHSSKDETLGLRVISPDPERQDEGDVEQHRIASSSTTTSTRNSRNQHCSNPMPSDKNSSHDNDGDANVGSKRKKESRASLLLHCVQKADVGKVVEMMESAKKAWFQVRIVDVIGTEILVCPEGETSISRQSWSTKWIPFRYGFIRSVPPDRLHGASPAKKQCTDGRNSRACPDSKGVATSRRLSRLAASPVARALALERGGAAKLPSPVKVMARIRKKPQPKSEPDCHYSREKAKSEKAKPEGAKHDKEKDASEARSRRDCDTKNDKSKEVGRKTSKEMKDKPTGSKMDKHVSPPPDSAAANTPPPHRRDWGLMQIDVVGRNRPPFARTLLCHGAIQAGVTVKGDALPAASWVVKRWPEKSARRKVDFEVHEKIRENPAENIVNIVDAHVTDGVLMEFCKEGDLQTLMTTSRRKYTPVRTISERFLQIMNGIAHLHRLKIVHSDISPNNVFLRKRDKTGTIECVIGDFGHSYIVSQHAESRSSVADHCGQGLVFVAPEVGSGSASSMASDIYSAGRILEQMLSLSKQFKENFDQESKSLVRTLQNLARIMLSPHPKCRPSAAAAVKILSRVAQWRDTTKNEPQAPKCL